MKCEWHQLGEYIEPCNTRNSKIQYGVELIEGVNSDGEFCATKANTDGIDLKPYKIVHEGDFVYNPSRVNIGSLAYRVGPMCIVSHLYVVFHLTKYGSTHLLPEFLWIFLNRDEFRRLISYRNFGSQRPEFNYHQMAEVMIPVPSIDEQRKVVDAWQGLRRMKEENEQVAESLMALCRSYMQELKKTWPMRKIGQYILHSDDRNEGQLYGIDSVRGISVDKTIIDTKADLTNVPLGSYKLFRPEEFCYVTVTSRNGERVSIAENETDETFIVSGTYEVGRVSEKSKLLPGFLSLWMSRSEFDRIARFNSWGSARETFNWSDMCRVKIPLPPKEVQESVVAVYRAAMEAKRIAAEADELSRQICPALIQHVVRGGK